MKAQIRIVLSIVISAVLLGLVVSFCLQQWMPQNPWGWVAWGAMALCGVYAIFRIASLSKMLELSIKEAKEKKE